jgi:hypothetical protein
MTNYLDILLKRIALLKSRSSEEEGIAMILTIVFLMTAGMVMIFMIWGIAYTTSVQTRLYGATQVASYAAVNEVVFAGGYGASPGVQPPFACNNGGLDEPTNSNPVCDSGQAADTARTLLQASLQGQLGLSYATDGSGNVQLLDAQGNVTNGILAYQVGVGSGAARSVDPGCAGTAEIDSTTYRTCWLNPGRDLFNGGQKNYSSGVVVITKVTVPFVPGCNSLILCPRFTFINSVPATVGQQNPSVNK